MSWNYSHQKNICRNTEPGTVWYPVVAPFHDVGLMVWIEPSLLPAVWLPWHSHSNSLLLSNQNADTDLCTVQTFVQCESHSRSGRRPSMDGRCPLLLRKCWQWSLRSAACSEPSAGPLCSDPWANVPFALFEHPTSSINLAQSVRSGKFRISLPRTSRSTQLVPHCNPSNMDGQIVFVYICFSWGVEEFL